MSQIIQAADAVVEAAEALAGLGEHPSTRRDCISAVHHAIGRYRFVVEQAVEVEPWPDAKEIARLEEMNTLADRVMAAAGCGRWQYDEDEPNKYLLPGTPTTPAIEVRVPPAPGSPLVAGLIVVNGCHLGYLPEEEVEEFEDAVAAGLAAAACEWLGALS